MLCIVCLSAGKQTEAVTVAAGWSLCDEDIGRAVDLWTDLLSVLVTPMVARMAGSLIQMAAGAPDSRPAEDIPDAFKELDDEPPQESKEVPS